MNSSNDKSEIQEGELNKNSFVATFRIPKAWLPEIKTVTAKYHNSRSEFYRNAIMNHILMLKNLGLD